MPYSGLVIFMKTGAFTVLKFWPFPKQHWRALFSEICEPIACPICALMWFVSNVKAGCPCLSLAFHCTSQCSLWLPLSYVTRKGLNFTHWRSQGTFTLPVICNDRSDIMLFQWEMVIWSGMSEATFKAIQIKAIQMVKWKRLCGKFTIRSI